MTSKETLIQEIEQAPDYLVEEVLDFLLFVKKRLQQKSSEPKAAESDRASKPESFLDFIDRFSNQIPQEEWQKLPSDLSKNVDHYLYGSPKVEE